MFLGSKPKLQVQTIQRGSPAVPVAATRTHGGVRGSVLSIVVLNCRLGFSDSSEGFLAGLAAMIE